MEVYLMVVTRSFGGGAAEMGWIRIHGGEVRSGKVGTFGSR